MFSVFDFDGGAAGVGSAGAVWRGFELMRMGLGWEVVFVGAVGEDGGKDCGDDWDGRTDVVESVWVV